MKKLFIVLLTLFTLISCKCTSNNCFVTENPCLDVEATIAIDRQETFLNCGPDYRWFETGVVLKNWLDEDNDGSVEMIVNVFQVVENLDSTSFDTMVYKYQHTADGTIKDSIHGFWVEDEPLNEVAIVVTFKEAFEKVMEVNLPKPHSRQVVLRKEVGPVDANPQWIFGNSRAQLYVDAVTGEVSEDNPAFRGLNLGTPLGEWP